MFDFIWDTRQYFFWLLIVSLLCFILERIFTWRKHQQILRQGWKQDVFFLVFNGHYAGILVAYLMAYLVSYINSVFTHFHFQTPETIQLIATYPFIVQFLFYLILQDFLAWCTHALLHRIPFLWKFHQLHHSITELDWIGNFRFHWMEIIIYQAINYFPLVILGVNPQIILWIAIISTLIGHLNHANIRMDYGILRYIFNSPRLHVWHHDSIPQGKHGVNYGVIFSLWDWIFGTAYYPKEKDHPDSLGFEGLEHFPTSLWQRLTYPFYPSGKKLKP
jgi:sterol desaturase/sphingolipid hydroxylase (fatty acid hydroxylase superfamily)